MFNRVTLLAIFSMLILCLAGCGGGEEKKTEVASQPAAAPAAPAPKPEENVPVYEITKDEVLSHPGWTSRNISVLGAKIGDKTNDIQKNFGPLDNSRTLTDVKEYLTIYQNQSLFVYTFAPTNRIRRFEVYDTLAKKIADEKLKKLLSTGDLKYMREIFGMEEGDAIQNTEDNSTEYPYDSRGFRFLKFKVKGKAINAIRFMEIKKAS